MNKIDVYENIKTTIDFIVAGLLILGTGLIINLVLSNVKNIKYRIAISIVIMILFGLIWAELAVGIFGTPFGGQ